MELDPQDFEKDTIHRIATTIVSPRPIAWVSTETEERDNLAPFSYFNIVSTYPLAVMISPGLRDGEPKDTRRMAKESGEFVANLVTEEMAETMEYTGAPLGDGVSEFEHFGIDRVDAKTVEAPRVANSPACLECTVIDSIVLHSNEMIIGEVEHIYVDESIETDGVIDMKKVDAVGRIGGPWYTGIDILEVERKGFGPWTDSVPLGFYVDEDTRWLMVDDDEFQRVRRALIKYEEGTSPSEVANRFEFPLSKFETALGRKQLYLDGVTENEAIEFALTEGGYDTGMTY